MLSPDTNETPATLTVTKQANGAHRWIAISSSAYRDRDGEIVSTKALEDDCARADADGNYGPLLWWHDKRFVIGQCDFNAMHGRMLVESGTFKNERIAEAFKAHANELALSIGFNHAHNEPDADGVFNAIRRFERSSLPRNRESNLFTTLGAVMKELDMTKDKKEELEKLVGAEVVSDLIAQADTTQKAADDAAVAFKEFPPKAEADDEECAEGDTECEDAKKMPPKAEKKAVRVKAATVGNMSIEDFGAALGTALQTVLAPVIEAQKAAKVEPQPNAEIEALKARLAELEGSAPKFTQKAASVTDGDADNAIVTALKAILGDSTTKEQPSELDRLVESQMRALKK